MQFSVIIPTLDRCALLANTLASVCTQIFPSDQYEVIVVDNGYSDGTRQMIEAMNRDGGKEIRYVFEPNCGLHHARHAGARSAQGEFLVYIDDDCVAEPNWLVELNRAYEELNADSAGGKILIRWDREPPSWIIPYEGVLGKLDRGSEMMLLRAGQCINGGNFSIRRSRLFEIGGFNPDQIGDYLIGDGESGLCKKIHQAGWRMAWVPDALVWHCQTVEKNATLKDLKRRYANNGVCLAYDAYRSQRPKFVGLTTRAAKQLVRAVIFKMLALPHRWQHCEPYYRYELSSLLHLAAARYFLRLIHDHNLRVLVLRKNWIED